MENTDEIKKKRVLLTLTPEMEKQTNEIKAHLGYHSRTHVIYYAITELYRKTFPTYSVKRGEEKEKPAPLSAEERAKVEIEVENKKREEKERKEYERMKGLCDALDGEEFDKSGTLMCRYNQFHYSNKFIQEVPFSILTEEMVEKQYTPNKEACLQAIETGGLTNLKPMISTSEALEADELLADEE